MPTPTARLSSPLPRGRGVADLCIAAMSKQGRGEVAFGPSAPIPVITYGLPKNGEAAISAKDSRNVAQSNELHLRHQPAIRWFLWKAAKMTLMSFFLYTLSTILSAGEF
jgi:hypothetical protein